MSSFPVLFPLGVLAYVVLMPILNWLCDRPKKLDLEQEKRLTDAQ